MNFLAIYKICIKISLTLLIVMAVLDLRHSHGSAPFDYFDTEFQETLHYSLGLTSFLLLIGPLVLYGIVYIYML